MNRTEHHTTVSDLPFDVQIADMPAVNAYVGEWELTGDGPAAENFWLVTIDGNGHSVAGHLSPEQMLDEAIDKGWDPAYVAPYGRHVIGKLDGVQLHEWMQDQRKKHISW